MIQTDDRKFVHAFFHDRLGIHWSEDFRGVLYVPDEMTGLVSNMDHVGVAIGYNGFIGRTCCMHIVIQRPEMFSARIIRESFGYAFKTANCNAVLVMVDSLNTGSLGFCERVGFREVMRIPDGGLDADLVVMRMLRAECRWLGKLH